MAVQKRTIILVFVGFSFTLVAAAFSLWRQDSIPILYIRIDLGTLIIAFSTLLFLTGFSGLFIWITISSRVKDRIHQSELLANSKVQDIEVRLQEAERLTNTKLQEAEARFHEMEMEREEKLRDAGARIQILEEQIVVMKTTELDEKYQDLLKHTEFLEETTVHDIIRKYHKRFSSKLGNLTPLSSTYIDDPKAKAEMNTSIYKLLLDVRDLGGTEKNIEALIKLRKKVVSPTFMLINDLLEKVKREVVDSYPPTVSETLEKCLELALTDRAPSVSADEALLQIAIYNLVDNALKYSRHKEDQQRIRISSSISGDDKWASIAITDNGLGVPSEQLVRLRQGKKGTGRNVGTVGGLGIGFSIAVSIVKEHGGSIEITSQEKVETTVTLHLPIFVP